MKRRIALLAVAVVAIVLATGRFATPSNDPDRGPRY